MKWSPDGQKIAFTTREGSIWLWENGTLFPISDTHGNVHDISWSYDSNQLAVIKTISYGDPNIQIWTVNVPNSPQLLRTFLDNGIEIENITSSSWHPSTNMMAISGNGVRIWNTDTGQLVFHLKEGVLTTDVFWAPDGSSLIARWFSTTPKIAQWNGQSGALIQDTAINSSLLVWGNLDQRVAMVMSDGSGYSLVLSNLAQLEVPLTIFSCAVRCPTIMEWKGNTIAGYGAGREIRIWDVSTDQIITTITGLAGPGFALDPSGSRLAYVQEGSLELVIVPVPGQPQSPDISPPASN